MLRSYYKTRSKNRDKLNIYCDLHVIRKVLKVLKLVKEVLQTTKMWGY